MPAPPLDLAREIGVSEDAAERDGPFLAIQHAEREFGRGHVGRVLEAFGADACRRGHVAHPSRHSFNLARPRRTQLFIVPSGIDWRSASSA